VIFRVFSVFLEKYRREEKDVKNGHLNFVFCISENQVGEIIIQQRKCGLIQNIFVTQHHEMSRFAHLRKVGKRER
jgi:hypothetical protein